MFRYSANRNDTQRAPPYSVKYPATSSASASTRSNGVRFVSAKLGRHEDQEADELGHDVPHAGLGVDDSRQRQRPRRDHDADQRESLRDLVGDQLGGGPHRPEERVLRARGPAAEHDPVEGDRAEREQVERTDADIDAVEADLRPEDVLRVAERDDRERGEGRQDRDDRRRHVEEADRRRRPRLLLRRELDDLGDRREHPERADPVGPVPALEAAEQLALGDRHDRDQLEGDHGDHERLDDLDPPRLVIADRCEHHESTPRRRTAVPIRRRSGRGSSRGRRPRSGSSRGGCAPAAPAGTPPTRRGSRPRGMPRRPAPRCGSRPGSGPDGRRRRRRGPPRPGSARGSRRRPVRSRPAVSG